MSVQCIHSLWWGDSSAECVIYVHFRVRLVNHSGAVVLECEKHAQMALWWGGALRRGLLRMVPNGWVITVVSLCSYISPLV